MKKIKILLYVCKDKSAYLHIDNRKDTPIYKKYYLSPDSSPFDTYEPDNYLNGKIVAECDYEVEEIDYHEVIGYENYFYYETRKNRLCDKLHKESCLNGVEMKKYLGKNGGYAIHIKNLTIFDKPRELNCYFLEGKPVKISDDLKLSTAKAIKRAPQNMCYVRGCNTGEKYVLISIRPEWICLILNGEKTIELRKKVLKEMLKCQEK